MLLNDGAILISKGQRSRSLGLTKM